MQDRSSWKLKEAVRSKGNVALRGRLGLSRPFFCCQQLTTGPESNHRDMTGKEYVYSLLMHDSCCGPGRSARFTE
jgi:hypothetical protein